MTKLEQIKAECRKDAEEIDAFTTYAKSLLTAIKALEEAADDCHIQASNALEQICQSWPDPVQSNS